MSIIMENNEVLKLKQIKEILHFTVFDDGRLQDFLLEKAFCAAVKEVGNTSSKEELTDLVGKYHKEYTENLLNVLKN